MFLDIAGLILIFAGLLFAWKGKGAEDAGAQAFKINISGRSWLILVVLGVALIGVERYLPDKQPPSPPQVETLNTEAFDYDALSLLWDNCGGGDDDACNQLYFDSPANSEWEVYGSTCGDRAPEPTFGACPFVDPTETT